MSNKVIAEYLSSGEPIYQARYLGDGGGGWFDVDHDEFFLDKTRTNYQTRTLYVGSEDLQQRLADAERRNADLLSAMELMADNSDDCDVVEICRNYLNPNPEAASHDE